MRKLSFLIFLCDHNDKTHKETNSISFFQNFLLRLSKKILSVCSPSISKSIFSDILKTESFCPVNLFEVMSLTQFFLCQVTDWFDFVFIDDEQTIGPHQFIAHKCCVMCGYERLEIVVGIENLDDLRAEFKVIEGIKFINEKECDIGKA